ncbi:MAG: DUF882 domain-containing protein [Alphaproteobacteria bacterium]|nr:DUF882 domain-containing protein [Alphaproteobacteria bacterium]
MNTDRRTFMRSGGAVLLGAVASPMIARPASALVALPEVKSLSFDNLHTGEKLKVDYWNHGSYLPDALVEVNHFLRDYRNNEVHAIEPKLLDLLSVLHARLDSKAPFQVISGYRSPATNAMLHAESHGVAAKSLHMQGMAIDIRLADRALDVLHTTARDLKLGGVGYYPASDFVHVDVGRVRYW